MKAGTWQPETSDPGTVIFDNFEYGNGGSPPPAEITLVADDFNDNSIDSAKWHSSNLFSGFSSLLVPITETAQRLEVGPLLQNAPSSQYRGIRTLNTYNFTGAYTYVELVQAPSSATKADAMFTVGANVDAYYRIYVSDGKLFGQRKIGATKTTFFTIPYDPVTHRFLRIRHDATTGKATLDTAPNNGGAPGTWVERYSETWHASIPLTTTLFEMKGGTWQCGNKSCRQSNLRQLSRNHSCARAGVDSRQ